MCNDSPYIDVLQKALPLETFHKLCIQNSVGPVRPEKRRLSPASGSHPAVRREVLEVEDLVIEELPTKEHPMNASAEMLGTMFDT